MLEAPNAVSCVSLTPSPESMSSAAGIWLGSKPYKARREVVPQFEFAEDLSCIAQRQAPTLTRKSSPIAQSKSLISKV